MTPSTDACETISPSALSLISCLAKRVSRPSPCGRAFIASSLLSLRLAIVCDVARE